jgi:uncharacterized membrane protein HdeD (DUF308 family)
MINDLLSGGFVMAAVAIGVFFLRFWRKSGDRLFLMFAIAFWMLGANRLGLSLTSHEEEGRTWFYVLRLIAFLIILAAIIDKNRGGSGKADAP